MPFKIFYLDDEPDLLLIFEDSFSSPDLEITTFTDPDMAIKAIKQAPPDLLVLDYRMPNTNGDEVAKSIDASIPKILITGDLHIVPEATFLQVFRKPYDLIELRTYFEQFIKLSSHDGSGFKK